MDTNRIISEIDGEIARLNKAKELLQGAVGKRGPGRPRGGATKPVVTSRKSGRRKMSADARARISVAQKARWSKVKAKRV
jgi:hypothetical protein